MNEDYWEYDTDGNRQYYDHASQTMKTMIYTEIQKKQLADSAVGRAEAEAKTTGKVLDEAEKERLWNLIKAAVEGS